MLHATSHFLVICIVVLSATQIFFKELDPVGRAQHQILVQKPQIDEIHHQPSPRNKYGMPTFLFYWRFPKVRQC